MFPIHDNIPSRTVPFVNYIMIGLCSAAFFMQVSSPQGQVLVEQYGMIPVRITEPDEPVILKQVQLVREGARVFQIQRQREAAATPIPALLTIFSCIFLHGGWMHFLGNMWFLYIFGDNVEDRLGHVGYVVFYLLAGATASLAHLFSSPESMVPTIGASGAIAGVMGAYMFLYPKAMVTAVIPIFILIEIMVLPAPVFLGIWFAFQFFNGVATVTATQTSGVAWWAHIGGFAAGAIVAAALNGFHMVRPKVEEIRPQSDRIRFYRKFP